MHNIIKGMANIKKDLFLSFILFTAKFKSFHPQSFEMSVTTSQYYKRFTGFETEYFRLNKNRYKNDNSTKLINRL
ncbi:hypothetical protein FLACOL7796_01851 [Flavobacterium collinsii]|uniref:HTH araC/xylS-type domain-containing protein n=1 Tax=Flavobacterium collinsii TaxID=1114861 RepID=A0ABM8KHS7_9FLAO|nr:hypothetical protein FLACOL7796_01851 [Flavobacterium collinsii]